MTTPIDMPVRFLGIAGSLRAYSTVSGHLVQGFRPPWSEAAERPTESLVSAPDGHLLSSVSG